MNIKRGKARHLVFIVAIIVVFLFIFIGVGIKNNLTGSAVFFQPEVEYNEGEPITGDLNIYVKKGELIPSDSRVLVMYGDTIKEFSLDVLLEDEEIYEGNYYAEGSIDDGRGEGFGYPSYEEIFPEVSFELSIVSEEDSEVVESDKDDNSGSSKSAGSSSSSADSGANEEEPENEESDLESPAPDSNSIVSEDSEDSESEPSEESSDEKETSEVTKVTGRVVDGEFIVDGSVSRGDDFVYDVSDSESVEIVDGSVMIDGEEVNEDLISLERSGDEVIVSTYYSIYEPRFGREYLDEDRIKYTVDFSAFEVFANPDLTSVKTNLVYEEKIIAQESKELVVRGTEVELSPVENGSVVIDTRVANEGIVIGKPVKWRKKVSLGEAADKIVVELPENSSEVRVVKTTKSSRGASSGESVIVGVNDDGSDNVEVVSGNVDGDISVTGRVTAEIVLDRENEKGFFSFLSDFFGITGNVISESIEVEGSIEEVEIEYETPGPYAVEVEESEKKTVTIVDPTGPQVEYENVLAFTEISEDWNVRKDSSVRIYWQEEARFIDAALEDFDDNGIMDYAEWIVPHLSNQTFEIIYISDSAHLDSSRELINNIYEEVSELDGVWSETINSGEYVRVTFEEELDSSNDITVYPRAISGAPSINVYEADGDEVIVSFDNLNNNQLNQVFLTNLDGSQDVFDLKVIGGSLQFDYIVDPKDSTPPTVTINSPENITYLRASVTINVSLDELGDAWYNVDDGANTSIGTNDTGFVDSVSLSNGTFVLNVFANDSAGNNGSSSVVFTVNTSGGSYYTRPFDSETSEYNVTGEEDGVIEDGEKYVVDQEIVFEHPTYGKRFSACAAFSEGNVNISGLKIRASDYKTAVDLREVSGCEENRTLYVPNTLSSGVYLCPNAHELAEVSASCEGVIRFTYDEAVAVTTRSGITASIEDGNYKLLNISGTGAGESITDCTTLTDPGSYEVDNSISTSSNTCIVVGNDDVIINGNGFTVSRTTNGGLYGIDARGRDNITINNITVSGFTTSVSVSSNTQNVNSGNLTITDSDVEVITTAGYEGSANSNQNGTNGGDIVLDNVSFDSVSSAGGDATPDPMTPGIVDELVNGRGGSVTIIDGVIDLDGDTIDISDGEGVENFRVPLPTLTINYSSSLSDASASYTGSPYLVIEESSVGQIDWEDTISISGLSFDDISLSNNFVSVDESISALGSAANVTFYGMPENFTSPLMFRDGVICDDCTNYTSLNAATVILGVTGFSNYTVGDVENCLQICTEGEDCTINYACELSSSLCSDGICNFGNLVISDTLSTGIDESGNGNDLTINLTGNISFSSGSLVNFSGVDGSTGGDGGVVNITVPNLFNRTDANFSGVGGDSSSSADGGDGGSLILYYRGLVGSTSSWDTDFSGGSSSGGSAGTDGAVTRNKDLTCVNSERDPDVNDDGLVSALDYTPIALNYNKIDGESGFTDARDLKCDDKLNVVDISRVGFQYTRGT